MFDRIQDATSSMHLEILSWSNSDSGRFGCRQRIHVPIRVNRDHASRSGVLRVSGMCIQHEDDVKCCDSSNSDSLSPMILSELKRLSFLADRTNGRAIGTVLCLSVVCLSVCDVMYCG